MGRALSIFKWNFIRIRSISSPLCKLQCFPIFIYIQVCYYGLLPNRRREPKLANQPKTYFIMWTVNWTPVWVGEKVQEKHSVTTQSTNTHSTNLVVVFLHRESLSDRILAVENFVPIPIDASHWMKLWSSTNERKYSYSNSVTRDAIRCDRSTDKSDIKPFM